ARARASPCPHPARCLAAWRAGPTAPRRRSPAGARPRSRRRARLRPPEAARPWWGRVRHRSSRVPGPRCSGPATSVRGAGVGGGRNLDVDLDARRHGLSGGALHDRAVVVVERRDDIVLAFAGNAVDGVGAVVEPDLHRARGSLRVVVVDLTVLVVIAVV